MERKLVTVRKVNNVEPIPNSDNIEHVTVDGWKVVCKKGDFKVDDMALFCEVDSFLPIRPEFEFLRKSCYKKLIDGTEGMRLKTIRLRGALSQGLLLPLSLFPDIDFSDTDKDYTEVLGVTKWEPINKAVLCGNAKGNYPTELCHKTDQERVQNLKDWFDKYKDVEFECTVKLDGSSATYIWYNNELRVCSRNIELKTDDKTTTFVQMADKLELKDKLSGLAKNYAIQGELCGPGIGGNPMKFKEHQFFVFDIFDIEKQCYVGPDDRQQICKTLGLQHVPIIGVVKPFTMSMDELLKFAEGPCAFNGELREGLVFKSMTTYNGTIKSFKVINNEYLLKHEQ